MINSHTTMREKNVHMVLSEIINNPEISRAEISKNTQLNKATISEIVRELIDTQYVVETGIGRSSAAGGRKPILLKINKKAGISLSFDIRYDNLTYMVNYLNGQIIKEYSKTVEINKDNIVDLIRTVVKQVKDDVIKTPYGIIGITIAIHGITSENKILFTPSYDLDKIDLAQQLIEKLKIPVYIENEANLAALAEASMDNTHENLITCSIHTGVGAGIIINEKLYRGFEGRSGEIGHTTLYPDGLKCACGNFGCIEQYCSQKAVLKFYREQKDDEDLTIVDLVKGFNKDEAVAVKIIEDFAKNLGIGLSSLMGMYGPEIVYISSLLINRLPIIIDLIEKQLENTMYNKVPIALSKFYNQPSLFGATVMNIQKFLEVDAIKVSDQYKGELIKKNG